MKREELTLSFLENNVRIHSVEVELRNNDIVGESENGYPRMIVRIIDPLTKVKSDFIVQQYKSAQLFEVLLMLFKDKNYKTLIDDRSIKWLHFDVNMPGVTVTIDTKEYLDKPIKKRILNKVNIFIFKNEINNYQRIVAWILDSLPDLDGTGNKPNFRYYY